MSVMLEYNSVLDQYKDVIFDEFSDSSEEENEDSGKKSNALLILKKRSFSKARSSLIKHFNQARIISKSGKLNTFLTQLHRKNISYIRDLGNTLLTLQWRWVILTLFLVNFICFIVFGCLWWVLAYVNGDYRANVTDKCIQNTQTLTGYVLLSVETITTIGYGYRVPTENCRGNWILLTLQALLNVAIQGALVSIVYVKIAKPSSNISTSIFSKKAVICLRDGTLRFIFRIHDFKCKIWCGTYISLYFMDKEHIYPNTEFELIQMNIEAHGLLIFPLQIEHIIDERSPLWTFRPLDILQSRFEIIAVAEGSSNITGQVSQNRTSFSNSDIFWGHRFQPCVEFDEEKSAYVVDYKKFKQTIPFDTPLCSAKKMKDVERRIKCQKSGGYQT